MARPKKEVRTQQTQQHDGTLSPCECVAILDGLIDTLIAHFVDEYGNDVLPVTKKLKALKEALETDNGIRKG